ncbi:phosphatidylserine decarboxylase [Ereboglobus sp. PH5-5]|uniref:archaetidylserine decarboxylase n=1 Tax=Ereboglobus sp. PH5-5 TaxID=2940529 RepID=UPI002404AEFA|nr:archaetidylserine decarboxylase [Ereboglobus sp. PH5-5]MDF9832304.1 phosphatidylserine decarboxylase [Ereboglobus sp. PH5-5]
MFDAFMAREPIQFYNRHTKQLETEKIYKEGWLRFTYENPVGRFFLWAFVKRKFFSWHYGWKMNWRSSARYVLPFVIDYGLEEQQGEFARSVFDFRTFNEFFMRALKHEARPIAPGDDTAVFPADGRHLVFPDVDKAGGFYVKGSKFALEDLLGEGHLPEARRELTRKFAGGAMVISRLCPVDYHRFHFAAAGKAGKARLIKGALYSVHPIALRRRIEYLVQNKRMITLVETDAFGTMASIEVGATNVGSIIQTYPEDFSVKKGEEKGLFKFGGSCVITLFEKGRIKFDDDLVAQSEACVETFAKMGDRLGVRA